MYNIVFSTDTNYVGPTSVAVRSLVDTFSHPGLRVWFFISPDVTAEQRGLLSRICAEGNAEARFVNMDYSLFAAGHLEREISVGTYFRFAIPHVLADCDKVLYLDGDILVRESLEPLFRFDLGNNLVAGVVKPSYLTRHYFRRHIRRYGLDPANYVNGGVLLINARLWREENLKERLMARIHEKFTFQDQDIINIECRGRIALLPIYYNSIGYITDEQMEVLSNRGIYTATEIRKARENPAIYHYAEAKPWKRVTYWWRQWWDIRASLPEYSPEKEQQALAATLQKPRKKSFISKIFGH